MSRPFILWTLRRTGGTALMNLLADLAGGPRLMDEPFNWDRDLGWISRAYDADHNENLLRQQLREALAERPSVKHAFEVVHDRLSWHLMDVASELGYRHILLTREDEEARLLSLELAGMTGHWGAADTRAAHQAIRDGQTRLPPIDLAAMLDEMRRCAAMTAEIELFFDRLAIAPMRLGFDDLYGDQEDARAHILRLCDYLAIHPADATSFDEKLNDALQQRGQNSAGVLDAIPNLAEARQVIGAERARQSVTDPNALIQDCALPPSDQFLIRIAAPLLPNREIYIDDAAGESLLALMCRTERRRGQETACLAISRRTADGGWLPALTLDLPDGGIEAPFEVGFGWGVLQLRAAGQLLLALNPMLSFGEDVTPAQAARLRTNYDTRRLTLSTGTELARQIALGSRLAALGAADPVAAALRPGVTLLLLVRGAEIEARMADLAPFADRFAAVRVIDVFAEGETGIDARIDAALAQVATRQMMVVSGNWPAARLAEVVEAHAAAPEGENRLVPLNAEIQCRPGFRWGFLMPARLAGRAALRAVGGLVLPDPALMALAGWRPAAPVEGPHRMGFDDLRRSQARLPYLLRRDGGTQAQMARPAAHPLLAAPMEAPDPRLAAAGLAQHPLPRAAGPTSPRALLARLTPDLEAAAADALLLTDAAEGEAMAAAVAALGRGPLAENAALPAGTAGLRLSRDTVAALLNWPASDPGDPLAAALDAPQDSLAGLIAALETALPAAGFALALLPAPEGLTAAETGPDGAAEAVWVYPHAVLEPLLRGAAAPETGIAPSPELQAMRRLTAGPAGLADLVVQAALAHQPLLVDVVSNLDMDRAQPRRIDRALRLLTDAGLTRDPELTAALVARLAQRRYFDEVRRLVATEMRRGSPQTRLALLTADIAASVFNPDDDRFTGEDIARHLPADLPAATPLGAFGEAMTHYLSARRDWAALLAVVDLVGPERLTNFSYEHWIMARIGLGMTEGTEALLTAGRAAWRLHEWSHRRLTVQLAYRSGDKARLKTAIAGMLASDPEMAPLTAMPTPFTALTDEPGIAAGQLACVIVVRNEFVRLKWLVDYYRALGVDQFVLIDNGSTDETVPHFSGQPDIRIFRTDEAYRDSRYGVKWHNEVCDRYFQNRWVLTVDADEVLVFDGADQPGALKALIARLDAAGDEAFSAAMIDMYADGPLDEVAYRPGDSLLTAFPLFDGSGYWFDRTASFPDTTVSGGVRIRRFWNDRHDPRLPYLSMQKTPLVRWHEGFRYISSTHEMTPCRVSAETGALLHFKFLPDFHERAMEEVARGQHYDGAREYRIYAEFLKEPENRSFRYPGSVRYEGPQTLIDARLIVPAGTAAPTGGGGLRPGRARGAAPEAAADGATRQTA